MRRQESKSSVASQLIEVVEEFNSGIQKALRNASEAELWGILASQGWTGARIDEAFSEGEPEEIVEEALTYEAYRAVLDAIDYLRSLERPRRSKRYN